jgi:hypothetical protein
VNQAARILAIAAIVLAAPPLRAQHLWWHAPKSAQGATCLYGEVTVLQSGPTIYYCGCNWWPGAAAGGYTGIQEQADARHNMIFSIWDTSKDRHPNVLAQNSRTHSNRFGGEGTGAHTHLNYAWKVGQTYRYFAVKKQDPTGAKTLCTVFFYDDEFKRWVDEATISSPNNGDISVKSFGGGLNSFLENWSGKSKELPKLALYRLWLGTNPNMMESVNDGRGDGEWGTLNDCFFLAEGADETVRKTILRNTKHGSRGQSGVRGSTMHISERHLPPSLTRLLSRYYAQAPGQ